MPWLNGIVQWVALAGAVGLLVAAVALAFAVTALRRTRRQVARMNNLLRNSQATDIEQVLSEQWSSLRRAEEGVSALSDRVGRLEAVLPLALKRVGLVRYNAFPGAGAELSFSLALMDDQRDGIVLTGLYGREETRMYAKPLRSGASQYQMSSEEKEAVQAATEGRGT